MAPAISKIPKPAIKLNRGQKRTIKRILRDVECGTKRNRKPLILYCCGQAGTGKSLLIRALVKLIGLAHVLVCAPVAQAARLIKGKTVHAAFNLNPFSEEGDEIPLPSTPHLRLLIIDEVSMLDATLLKRLERRMRQIMGNEDVVFGGCTVVFFGDILQIPPVSTYKDTDKPNWIFKSPIWKHLVEYEELEQIMRQESDPEFGQMLQRWRLGIVTDEDREFLDAKAYENPHFQYVGPVGFVDTVGCFAENYDETKHQMALAHKNKDIGNLNREITYRFFRSDEMVDVCKDTFTKRNGRTSIVKSGIKFRVGVGSRVMINKNIGSKLVNGEIATVHWFSSLRDKVTALQIRLSNGEVVILDRVKSKVIRGFNNETWRETYPINSAYASTYHKAQGQTLDDVFLTTGSGIPPTLFYVGCSRVRTRDGLHIMDLGAADSIAADPEALAEYKRLRVSAGMSALPNI